MILANNNETNSKKKREKSVEAQFRPCFYIQVKSRILFMICVKQYCNRFTRLIPYVETHILGAMHLSLFPIQITLHFIPRYSYLLHLQYVT